MYIQYLGLERETQTLNLECKKAESANKKLEELLLSRSDVDAHPHDHK